MDFTVENLCELLKRSRLVKAEDVPSIYDRWVVDAMDKAASSTHFAASWLVQQNLLTEYQASLLAKGLVDDFFLGDYKILERVGRGRMAGVYKAQRPDGGYVAIKVLPPSRTKVPSLMARFQRETTLARTFNHPNVVRSLDVGESNGLHYLVMELLDGETVDDVLQRRKRLPPAEAVAIVQQTLLGLEHLHELGVVHRDLKPANLMLVPGLMSGDNDTTLGRTVKILDIGLARRMFEESTPVEKLETTDVTKDGVLLGTPDYLSPEQARDPRAIDIRSDIYSLGCVLYHLLSGQTPFPDSNVLNLMIRHATETPRPIRDFVPNAPESIQPILDAMLAKRAEQRYTTPAAAAAALQDFLSSVSSAANRPPPTDAATQQPTGESTVDDRPIYPEIVSAPPLLVPVSPSLGSRRKSSKRSSTDRVPTARALKKSAAITRAAPVGKPHVPPPQLPDGLELVPLAPPPAPSPFATPNDDGALIVVPKRRPREDWIMFAIGAGVMALIVAIIFVLTMILR